MGPQEECLKEKIRSAPAGAYLLYGEESYLTEQFTRRIVQTAVGDENNAFDLHRLDGQNLTVSALEEAVEGLPMMAEYTCVLVRDLDISGMDGERLFSVVDHLPETCVLIFSQMTVQPDRKKGWQDLIRHVQAAGVAVNFERRSPEEVVRLLVSGAKRRGCVFAPADARYLLEQAGNDLHLLLRELDKLAALADGGVITRESIDRIGTKNLEARVFDLSKAILQGRSDRAYQLTHQLLGQREEPLAILGALSTAFCDIYRAQTAIRARQPVTVLAEDFKSYKGKEFRLRNAAGDASRLSSETLRAILDRLAATDEALKLSRSDPAILLEETIGELLRSLKRG